ncbi:methyltransferase domain-containing protein [Halioxenophilus sp. WMMB6]|uniref:methyltransferase domain-containing protein n=1 Tax=Halioxenophilus sp. WMMB6 TaxID=3073815 RepID=UPI00295F4E42|nr:methyltransferase domain-containing protein [Halioxenophilus sp. WMMB6]
MNTPDPAPQIDAARAYQSLFVPALFGQWAGAVADAAQLQAGQTVLDVACGTGVLSAEVLARVGAQGHVTGLDPNPGMLAVAAERLPSVQWLEAGAEQIPLPDATFDAVVSQFGLMFFQNRAQAVAEMVRVVKPSGRLVVAVWDAIEQIPGYLAELNLIERLAGQAAGDAVRAPFNLGDRSEVCRLVQAAGGRSTRAETLRGQARFATIRTMVEAELCGWLPVLGVHLNPELIAEILQQAETDMAPFTQADGQVVFDITAHIISAQRPL